MAGIPLQLRSGTKAQCLNFTGEPAEVVVDTDLNTLRVHDGVVAGGYPLARTFSYSFISSSSVVVNHNLNSSDIVVMCWSNDVYPILLTPTNIVINSLNQITVTFSTSVSGKIIIK